MSESIINSHHHHQTPLFEVTENTKRDSVEVRMTDVLVWLSLIKSDSMPHKSEIQKSIDWSSSTDVG